MKLTGAIVYYYLYHGSTWRPQQRLGPPCVRHGSHIGSESPSSEGLVIKIGQRGKEERRRPQQVTCPASYNRSVAETAHLLSPSLVPCLLGHAPCCHLHHSLAVIPMCTTASGWNQNSSVVCQRLYAAHSQAGISFSSNVMGSCFWSRRIPVLPLLPS